MEKMTKEMKKRRKMSKEIVKEENKKRSNRKKKKNEQINEKHERGVKLKWATPYPTVHRGPKKKIMKENRPFYNVNFSTIGCGIWSLLGRLQKEKKTEEKEKQEKW